MPPIFGPRGKKSLVLGRSPPQEQEEGPYSRLYILVFLKTTKNANCKHEYKESALQYFVLKWIVNLFTETSFRFQAISDTKIPHTEDTESLGVCSQQHRNHKKKQKKLSPFTCHLSPGMCHVSRVTCHLSYVNCHMSLTQTVTGTDPPLDNSPLCTMHRHRDLETESAQWANAVKIFHTIYSQVEEDSRLK